MSSLAAPPIPAVVSQHVEEAAILHNIRSALCTAPHVRLRHLARWDERIAAHLDGILIAGEFGWRLCEASLANPGPGEIFAAAVTALESRNLERFSKLLAVVEAMPETESGLRAALGWVSPDRLRGVVKDLLLAPNPYHRRLGLAACAEHSADAGAALDQSLDVQDPNLRAVALNLASRVGRRPLAAKAMALLQDSDPRCAYYAARACVLLGESARGLPALAAIARGDGPFSQAALWLHCKADTPGVVHQTLRAFARDPGAQRRLLRGAGLSGDLQYMPWMLQQMEDPKLACLAGESFSMITGLDLAYLDLELRDTPAPPPGPNDDPADDNVAIDEDDSLPWPDVVKLREWWQANQGNFAQGQRYFMGEVLSLEQCAEVLKNGFQRQRIAAAEHRMLLSPGTPLFNTSQPVSRQHRQLARIT